MINFLSFTIKRYARFLSYLAAFLGGMSIVLPLQYMLVPLAASVLLGSLAAYRRGD